MARDYKPRSKAKRSGSRSTRSPRARRGDSSSRRRSSAAQQAPGWQWLLAGLAMGLLVAAGVYLYDRLPGSGPPQAGSPGDAPPAAQTRKTPRSRPGKSQTPNSEAPREYAFYDSLPRFEVVITEQETAVSGSDEPATAVREPGTYELQAGSFRNHSDADRMQATLALQGIESRISVVTIDDDQTWHRVRIGPIDDLESLDRVRDRLTGAGVDFLVLRVGDDGG